LQGLEVPEAGHCPLSLSEGFIRIFGSIVELANTHLTAPNPEILHRCGEGAQPVGDDRLGSPVALHRALKKRQRGLAVPAFRGKDLQHLALVIDGPPAIEIMHLAADSHESLVQVPGLLGIAAAPKTELPNFGGKNRAIPAPLESHRFMADYRSCARTADPRSDEARAASRCRATQ